MGSRESSDSEVKMLIKRGPGIEGNLPFDKFCIFGTDMWLDEHQVKQIDDAVQSIYGPYSDQVQQSEDSGSFSTDEHVGYAVHGPKFIRRGPRFRGTRTFDKHCIYASDVWLNRYQVEQLIQLVEESPKEPIKYYVYRMSESSVMEKKSKMEFGAQFSKASLKSYLANSLVVPVECTTSCTQLDVTMKMGRTKKKAIITTGWAKAMKEYKIKEGNIVVFSFYLKGKKLHLLLVNLVPSE